MGSGCNTLTSSYNACPEKYSSDCVISQVDAVPLLGICCGDTVTEVETVIINKLLEVLSGTGIVLSSVTLDNCAFLKTMLGSKDKSLLNLIQLLIDANCTLRELIAQLQEQVSNTGDNFIFDLKCLVTVPPSSITKDQIIQLLINKVCDLQTQITNINNEPDQINVTVNNAVGNFLNTAINSCGGNGITKTGTGQDTKITFTGLPMLESIMFYMGTLSIFDSSGTGLEGTPACGWQICNGEKGSPDLRGYGLAMANQNMGNLPLDARVDPNVLNQPTAAAGYRDKKGDMFVQLTVAQLASHTHPVIDPGHTHQSDYPNPEQFKGSSFNAADASKWVKRTTSLSYTGISLGSVGGNQPHPNLPPTYYGVWIMRNSN